MLSSNSFFPMIASFGEVVDVKRRAAGSFVNGRWVEGNETTLTAQASVQPLAGKKIEFLPEAQRTGEELIAYITVEVFASTMGAANHDIIVWRGARYKVIQVRRWLPTQRYWEAIITKEVDA